MQDGLVLVMYKEYIMDKEVKSIVMSVRRKAVALNGLIREHDALMEACHLHFDGHRLHDALDRLDKKLDREHKAWLDARTMVGENLGVYDYMEAYPSLYYPIKHYGPYLRATRAKA